MSNLAVPAKEQLDAMIRSQQSRFIKTREYDPDLVTQIEDDKVGEITEGDKKELEEASDFVL